MDEEENGHHVTHSLGSIHLVPHGGGFVSSQCEMTSCEGRMEPLKTSVIIFPLR